MGWTQGDVEDAISTINAGGLALVKSDVGYGIVGNSEISLERMYSLKGRPDTKPLVVLGNLHILREVIELTDPQFGWVAATVPWTPLAIVGYSQGSKGPLAPFTTAARSRLDADGSIACFLNIGQFPDRLVETAYSRNMTLIATSANLSGSGNSYRFSDVPTCIKDSCTYVLDDGPGRYESADRLATTIVDIRIGQLIRRGVHAAAISRSVKYANERGLFR